MFGFSRMHYKNIVNGCIKVEEFGFGGKPIGGLGPFEDFESYTMYAGSNLGGPKDPGLYVHLTVSILLKRD